MAKTEQYQKPAEQNPAQPPQPTDQAQKSDVGSEQQALNEQVQNPIFITQPQPASVGFFSLTDPTAEGETMWASRTDNGNTVVVSEVEDDQKDMDALAERVDAAAIEARNEAVKENVDNVEVVPPPDVKTENDTVRV
ncbi:MAG: hypothetical protein M3P94_05795 [Chloroflexota bacterium]|nr:hypothetical protein [Chloroflexota bacterium]